MTPLALRRYSDLEPSPALQTGLDAIFFEASNTKSFPDDAARAAFRERWLGRYLADDARTTFLALDGAGMVAGYVAGSLEDPASSRRFADVAYFQTFKTLTRHFPAHLHVNVAASHRNLGVGAKLMSRFIAEAALAACPGVHVVTSRAARNVTFYLRNGFREEGADGEGAREIVFLARAL